jgi:hypothetical protein
VYDGEFEVYGNGLGWIRVHLGLNNEKGIDSLEEVFLLVKEA